MGLLIGGGAVFLLGTRTGRNLVKIVSEQGLDGLVNLLEEYDLVELEEEEGEKAQSPEQPNTNGETKQSPKKRFFRRVKK